MADIQSTDDEPSTAANSRRFGRFTPPSVPRRFTISKFWRVVTAAILLGAVLIAGGSSLTNSIVAWLKKRPEYAFTLDQVRFEPAPPGWLKGGRERLLDSLRPFAKSKGSTLDLDLGEVFTRMATSPWVRRVERVELGHPNVIRVVLTYRDPVTKVNRPRQLHPVVLDADGVVLPDDLDFEAIGPMITLEIKKPPADLQGGLAWPKSENGDKILEFARLAEFLAAHSRKQPEVLPRLDQISLYPEQKGVWIELGPKNWLLWGASMDSPDEPPLEEKWEVLRVHVAKSGPLKLIPNHFHQLRKDRISSVEQR